MNLKSGEFRIGNYLKINNNFVIVSEIKKESMKSELIQSADFSFDRHSSIQKIPLTQALFFKNGFRNLSDEDTFGRVDYECFIELMIKDNLIIGKNKNNLMYYFLNVVSGVGIDEYYLDAISAPMQYLHTLQNYYPAFSAKN